MVMSFLWRPINFTLTAAGGGAPADITQVVDVENLGNIEPIGYQPFAADPAYGAAIAPGFQLQVFLRSDTTTRVEIRFCDDAPVEYPATPIADYTIANAFGTAGNPFFSGIVYVRAKWFWIYCLK